MTPFYTNSKERKFKVSVATDKMKMCSKIWVVSGFTSIGYLLKFLADKKSKIEQATILIGNEPQESRRKKPVTYTLEREVKEYWLGHGLSVSQAMDAIHVLNLIKEGKVNFLISNNQHAKIFLTEDSVVVGSSNFSENGLNKQKECSVEFQNFSSPKCATYSKYFEDLKNFPSNYTNRSLSSPDLELIGDEDHRETITDQYKCARVVCLEYLKEGKDFNDEISDLLKKLANNVSWQEALARAVKEVLEFNSNEKLDEQVREYVKDFWPTQLMGFSQCCDLLKKYGHVLICDPTGSGKTKVGVAATAFASTLISKRKQQMHLCPPITVDNWDAEFHSHSHFGTPFIEVLSFGQLSKKNSDIDLSDINLLCIDECHAFINSHSNRSKQLRRSNPDFFIGITATPINKGISDILSLLSYLDLDNLEDDELDLLQKVRNDRNSISVRDRIRFRKILGKFIVRRTKREIKLLIESDKDRYRNVNGNLCIYPKQIHHSYKVLCEPLEREMGIAIRENSLLLMGLAFLPSEDKYKEQLDKEVTASSIIARSKALAVYNIRASLRSSIAAFAQHINGAEYACDLFDLPRSQERGNILLKLKKLKWSPAFRLGDGPEWMKSKESFVLAQKEEISIYERLIGILEKNKGNLSREVSKCKKIVSFDPMDESVIAFDSYPITIQLFRKIIESSMVVKSKVVYATGESTKSEKEDFQCSFSLTSKGNRSVIGLASDVMSESVNLQKANHLILLDTPSVIIKLEQRLGRIDRVDSEHSHANFYWPMEDSLFSLSGDSLIHDRLQEMASFIGSNIQLDGEKGAQDSSYLLDNQDSDSYQFNDIKDLRELREKIENGDDSVFSYLLDVQNLVRGDVPLIEKRVYDNFSDIEKDTKCRVSLVESEKTWYFWCLGATGKRPLTWVFWENHPDHGDYVTTDYSKICEKLREKVDLIVKDEKLDSNLEAYQDFCRKVDEVEIEILPKKRKRTLALARNYLSHHLMISRDKELISVLQKHLDLIRNWRDGGSERQPIDLYSLSDVWISYFKDFLNQVRNNNSRKIIVSDRLAEYAGDFHPRLSLLKSMLDKIYPIAPHEMADHRVVSCIIATPKKSTSKIDWRKIVASKQVPDY